MEKGEGNSIDKKQNGLKYSKNDKSSTLPRIYSITSTNTTITIMEWNMVCKIFYFHGFMIMWSLGKLQNTSLLQQEIERIYYYYLYLINTFQPE